MEGVSLEQHTWIMITIKKFDVDGQSTLVYSLVSQEHLVFQIVEQTYIDKELYHNIERCNDAITVKEKMEKYCEQDAIEFLLSKIKESESES